MMGTILNFIIGLAVIIGLIFFGIVLLAVCCWVSSIIGDKTKGTIIEKILNFIGKIIYYLFWIIVLGLLIVCVVGVAINVGSSIMG